MASTTESNRLSAGLLYCLLAVPVGGVLYTFWPLLQWQLDAARGWSLRLPVDSPPYRVTLVQEPGTDFYDSYLEIEREDGATAVVDIDWDDYRWRNAKVVKEEGKLHFVRDFGKIDFNTPWFDPHNEVVYSGFSRQTLSVSEPMFK